MKQQKVYFIPLPFSSVAQAWHSQAVGWCFVRVDVITIMIMSIHPPALKFIMKV